MNNVSAAPLRQTDYRTSPKRLKSHVVAMILYLPLGLALTIWSIARLAGAGEAGWAWLLGGLGLILLGLGLFSAWQWHNERTLQVTLFDDGLSYQRRGGHERLNWEEVAALYISHINGNPVYRLEKSDGRQLTFQAPLEAVEQLGEHLQEQVHRRVTPRLKQRFAAGEALSFGPFRISRAGLGYEGQELHWTGVERLQLANGKVVVHARNAPQPGVRATKPWARVRIGEVPNLFTLMALAGDFVAVEEISLVEKVRDSRGTEWA